jgi:hypothetical protein
MRALVAKRTNDVDRVNEQNQRQNQDEAEPENWFSRHLQVNKPALEGAPMPARYVFNVELRITR